MHSYMTGKLILLSLILNFSCCTPQKQPADTMNSDKLIEHVKKAINPKFKNWVLFSHGTYVIIEDTTVVDKKKYALEQIQEFGPVFSGGSAGDITVQKLNSDEGWSIGGHGYCMYTYVNPSELDIENPRDIDAGLFGRDKRDMDSKDRVIIYVSE